MITPHYSKIVFQQVKSLHDKQIIKRQREQAKNLANEIFDSAYDKLKIDKPKEGISTHAILNNEAFLSLAEKYDAIFGQNGQAPKIQDQYSLELQSMLSFLRRMLNAKQMVSPNNEDLQVIDNLNKKLEAYSKALDTSSSCSSTEDTISTMGSPATPATPFLSVHKAQGGINPSACLQARLA